MFAHAVDVHFKQIDRLSDLKASSKDARCKRRYLTRKNFACAAS